MALLISLGRDLIEDARLDPERTHNLEEKIRIIHALNSLVALERRSNNMEAEEKTHNAIIKEFAGLPTMATNQSDETLIDELRALHKKALENTEKFYERQTKSKD